MTQHLDPGLRLALLALAIAGGLALQKVDAETTAQAHCADKVATQAV